MAASVLGTAALLAWPATAGAVTVGTAEIIHPATGAPLDSGGSETTYGVNLPAVASCPGDTEHDGYHVYSYLVPAGYTPTQVRYTSLPSRWSGYFSYGAYYGPVNTAPGTGQVMTLPVFSWTRYSSYLDDLFPGGVRHATWEGGIACADSYGTVTNYWNTQILFTRTSSDPGGFVWRVVNSQPVSSNSTHVIVGVTLLVVAAFLGGLVLVLSRRQRRQSNDGGTDGAGPGGRGPGAGPDDGRGEGGRGVGVPAASSEDTTQPAAVGR